MQSSWTWLRFYQFSAQIKVIVVIEVIEVIEDIEVIEIIEVNVSVLLLHKTITKWRFYLNKFFIIILTQEFNLFLTWTWEILITEEHGQTRTFSWNWLKAWGQVSSDVKRGVKILLMKHPSPKSKRGQ